MWNELSKGLLFYGVFTLFGLIGSAFLLRIPSKSNLKLYLAKPLGLVLFAFPVWFLASLRLIKYNNQFFFITLFILALAAAIMSIALLLRNNSKLRKKILSRQFIITFLLSEVFTVLLYTTYLYIRGFNSQLDSTEKPMDILLYMSAGKTEYFPFEDPWQAGLPVNYYYYGFYVFSILNRISGVPYSMGYNFCLGIILISCVILSFAVVYKLTKSKLFSILGAGFVAFAGNIHYATCIKDNFHSDSLSTKCFYPAATRILDPAYTINEMPSYSFILGDMHPHVMGIPFFLTNLFLLHMIFTAKKPNYWLIGIFTVSLGTSFMINTWDFIVLGFLFAIIFFYKIYTKWQKQSDSNIFNLKDIKANVLKNKVLVISSLLFALSPVILFLPFLLHFHSPVEGIGFSPEFLRYNKQPDQDFQYPSSLWFHFGLWGGYFLMTTLSLATLFLKKEKFTKYAFPLFISLTAMLCILFFELFYFKDLFHIANPPYFRANTVFKLGYLAWILWSIGAPVLVFFMWQNLRLIRDLYIGVAADFVVIVLLQFYAITVFIYPYYSIKQAYSPALPQNINERKWTLDGSIYVKNKEPEDFDTIQWINSNIKDRSNIAEAVGNSYTYYARISTHTGMINPINWPSHEWTWRFKYPEDITHWKQAIGKSINTGYNEVDLVSQDVKTLYETSNTEEARKFIEKYKIEYIYIGNLERTTYTAINEDKFDEIGTIVFSSGSSKLYKI